MKAGILIGHLNDTRNESALIRTAEAMGATHVHVVNGATADIHSSVARGAEQHVSVHHWDDYGGFLGAVRNRNHSIVAVENTPGSVPLSSGVDYPVNPIFVVGNEARGVPKPVIDAADLTVEITQATMSYTRCLNTTVAGSIAIHDWLASRVRRDKQQHEFEVVEA